jgi:predicted acetyltransferase
MTAHPDRSPQLALAGESDSRLIESLLDDYLRELSSHQAAPNSASDSTNYPYLDRYWSEPGRHAFLVQSAGRTVGFALVRAPASTGTGQYHFAEFYIQPASRRLGFGRSAVLAIWKRFPGPWELQVHARNSAALQFWKSCAEAEARETPQVSELQTADGSRLQFNFHV